jgi:hypothetical protein
VPQAQHEHLEHYIIQWDATHLWQRESFHPGSWALGKGLAIQAPAMPFLHSPSATCALFG